MSISFHDFLAWEAVATDAFLVRGAYVTITGSFKSGALLGRIVYYYLPSKISGGSKLRVKHKGVLWIAKTRNEWQGEIYLTGKELDRALKQLIDKGLVAKKTFHFAGKPTLHVRLNIDTFLGMMDERLEVYKEEAESIFPKGEKQYLYNDPIDNKHKNDSGLAQKDDTPAGQDTASCVACGSNRIVSSDKKERCAYCLLRAGWQFYFPKKPQPRLGTNKYRTHSEARWKEKHFRDNWRLALETSSKSPSCIDSAWFTFEFFVKNDINYEHMKDDWMSWRDEKEYDKIAKHDNMEGLGQM